jgi:Cu(I)/Ag(I) efflux system membrane protein CusA/SilA
MIGGMISATILTLIVVPAIYGIWKSWKLKE